MKAGEKEDTMNMVISSPSSLPSFQCLFLSPLSLFRFFISCLAFFLFLLLLSFCSFGGIRDHWYGDEKRGVGRAGAGQPSAELTQEKREREREKALELSTVLNGCRLAEKKEGKKGDVVVVG